jgi:hypothetical protein
VNKVRLSFKFRREELIVCIGTYGGHLELSAFAHLSQRNVKVIQPGLVYVIEWAAGAPPPPAPPPAPPDLIIDEDAGMNEREKRRLRRDQQRARGRGEEQEVEEEEEEEGDPANGAVYVACVSHSLTSSAWHTNI